MNNISAENISEISPEVGMTDSALKRVQYLIKEEGNENLKFRVYITGGGCSGFQYGFSFDEITQPDDIIIEISTVKLVVDPLSMTYLSGAEVHYTEGLYGSHFSIKNPHAQTTCGCGSSFSV